MILRPALVLQLFLIAVSFVTSCCWLSLILISVAEGLSTPNISSLDSNSSRENAETSSQNGEGSSTPNTSSLDSNSSRGNAETSSQNSSVLSSQPSIIYMGEVFNISSGSSAHSSASGLLHSSTDGSAELEEAGAEQEP